MRRTPPAVALDPARSLRASDLRDGQRVEWRGEPWRVWSARGPRAGTVWLMRPVDDFPDHPETAAAPIRELQLPGSRQVCR